jgi:hypothetical protein
MNYPTEGDILGVCELLGRLRSAEEADAKTKHEMESVQLTVIDQLLTAMKAYENANSKYVEACKTAQKLLIARDVLRSPVANAVELVNVIYGKELLVPPNEKMLRPCLAERKDFATDRLAAEAKDATTPTINPSLAQNPSQAAPISPTGPIRPRAINRPSSEDGEEEEDLI